MTHYCVFRLDRTDGKAAEIRAATRPDHLAFMKGFAARVLIGGPLLDADGNARGGMMVIEAESEAEVREILARDQFEVAGLSGTIEVSP
ncbi:MAG TPA: YciI family protein, partial [Paracoccaceae bacterium]|nr:YciI family protein [Paracoccaceae bacterium]